MDPIFGTQTFLDPKYYGQKNFQPNYFWLSFQVNIKQQNKNNLMGFDTIENNLVFVNDGPTDT